MQGRGLQFLKGFGITSTLGGIIFYSVRHWQAIEKQKHLQENEKQNTNLEIVPASPNRMQWRSIHPNNVFNYSVFSNLLATISKFNFHAPKLNYPLTERLPFYFNKPSFGMILLANYERHKNTTDNKMAIIMLKPVYTDPFVHCKYIEEPRIVELPQDEPVKRNDTSQLTIEEVIENNEVVPPAPSLTHATTRDQHQLFKTPTYHLRNKIKFEEELEKTPQCFCTIV
jgi:hypothetical protein